MKNTYTIDLDAKIFNGDILNKKRLLKIDKNSAKKISGIIDYLLQENNAPVDELGYIENNKRAAIIIPKPGIGMTYNPSKIGGSVIVTFDKSKGKNKNLKIYENEKVHPLEKVIDNTLKKGKFIKLEKIPEYLKEYIY
jgi:hypothetical protein